MLFDFDGTLWDSEVAPYVAWQEIYRGFGQELTLDRWSAAIGTLGGFDPYADLERLTGAPVDRPALAERLRRRHRELIRDLPLRPGVDAYLSEARRLGLKLGIVSSDDREWISNGLAHLGVASGWDVISCADGDRARAKPEPDLYEEALRTLEFTPQDAIAIEDSPNGIRAAKEAGLFCVAVANTVTVQLDLSEADIQVVSLDLLPLSELLEAASRSA